MNGSHLPAGQTGTAEIIEIFSSIQGEGPYVGERQIFIRFANCNLDCGFCDVPKDAKTYKYNVDRIISKVKTLNKKIKHNTVVLTGGEPLLYAGFLKKLLPQLKKLKFKIYLETNATLPDELKKVIRHIDVVAADIKLPSVTNERPCWRAHQKFLRQGCKNNIFIKVVVSDRLKKIDFQKAIFLTKTIDKKIPFIVQPVTNGSSTGMGADKLQELQKYALRHLKNVLVIPQIHKILGVR